MSSESDIFIFNESEKIFCCGKPLKKVVLWHITNNCNQECKYCYGSFDKAFGKTFDGTSYKKKFRKDKEVPLESMLLAIDDFKEFGFKRIHIGGGEPLLRTNEEIWEFLEYIRKKDMGSFVLSNLTNLPDYFEEYFISNIFNNFSFSLDSLDEGKNDYLRGNTNKIINNIKEVLKIKEKYDVKTEIGLYVVATQKNIFDLENLINWARTIGINFITIQLVYLPKNHTHYDDLVIREDEHKKYLISFFEKLEKMNDYFKIPGNLLLDLNKRFLKGEKMFVKNCFCGESFLFVDGEGNVKRCPAKKLNNEILGNISEKRLRDFIKLKEYKNEVCKDFSLDCVCLWETVFPSTFELKI